MNDINITSSENKNNIERSSPDKSHNHKLSPSPSSSHCLYSTRFSICILCFIATSVILLQIIFPSKEPASSISSSTIFNQWGKIKDYNTNNISRLRELEDKLRESVTFLPLKDLRYQKTAMEDHTWFMSSTNDTHEKGEAQHLKFPSKASKGRVLCLKGRDPHDGSKNYYALAWPETLPRNASLMSGITFVSNNHYDYDNIWHGLSATMPFVSWHIKNQCAVPKRWVLYHWGELRTSMALWVETLMQATFGAEVRIETFGGTNGSDDPPPMCFEEAVVMRHNEGEMSGSKRMEVYDLIRCRSRKHCNVSTRDIMAKNSSIVMTVLLRDGARSFENSTKVIDVFENACKKVKGCKLMVAHARNLTICEQVKLMSLTDVLISPHGAQLTNMMLMDRNSSVMEFFPNGWLEKAGAGQYVFHWLASWSGMRHEGAWRDPNMSEPCEQYRDGDPRCFDVVKSRKIGFNETYFGEWALRVLNDRMRLRKHIALNDQYGNNNTARISPVSGICGC